MLRFLSRRPHLYRDAGIICSLHVLQASSDQRLSHQFCETPYKHYVHREMGLCSDGVLGLKSLDHVHV